ncbi:MAG TPA: hypothetical protein PLI34_16620, partial [Saprospiraceae bacterium]|nr:hypothetical protein [Saprospiraceae bacterium]
NEAATSASVAKFDFHKPKVRILQKENERCMEPLQFYLTVCLMLGLYWMARHPAWLAGCTDTLLTDPISGTILATLRRPCFVEPNIPTQ